jgi:hypothetical protein
VSVFFGHTHLGVTEDFGEHQQVAATHHEPACLVMSAAVHRKPAALEAIHRVQLRRGDCVLECRTAVACWHTRPEGSGITRLVSRASVAIVTAAGDEAIRAGSKPWRVKAR